MVSSHVTAAPRLEHKVYASDDGSGWQLHAKMQPVQDQVLNWLQGGPSYDTCNSQPVLTTPQLVTTSSTEVDNQVRTVLADTQRVPESKTNSNGEAISHGRSPPRPGNVK